MHDFPQELIRGNEVVELGQRSNIGDSGIVRIERHKVGNAQINQFLIHNCGIERFAAGSFMLTPLVQERHDYADPRRLAVNRGDDAL